LFWSRMPTPLRELEKTAQPSAESLAELLSDSAPAIVSSRVSRQRGCEPDRRAFAFAVIVEYGILRSLPRALVTVSVITSDTPEWLSITSALASTAPADDEAARAERAELLATLIAWASVILASVSSRVPARAPVSAAF